MKASLFFVLLAAIYTSPVISSRSRPYVIVLNLLLAAGFVVFEYFTGVTR